MKTPHAVWRLKVLRDLPALTPCLASVSRLACLLGGLNAILKAC
ncbi:hypothetical protein [Candidatus Campylobacter infans]|nr:hypothetical protein [Candidatus Campylobacter infans]